jgi:excisionase family DNA binding protein
MTSPEPWVGAEYVASHLGVNKDSVYRWIDKKGLPAHRVGRLFRFKLSEVDEWVRSGGSSDANEPDALENPTDE